MADIKEFKLNIKVDDGYRRIPVTNIYDEEIGVFYFNPTDIGIIERYNRLAETFESITEPLENLQEDDSDVTDNKYIDAMKEAENRLYGAVNELFGGDFAAAFFGKVNPFSPVEGSFYCEQALKQVGAFISEQFDAETKKFSEHTQKYTNRAQRRAKK